MQKYQFKDTNVLVYEQYFTVDNFYHIIVGLISNWQQGRQNSSTDLNHL